MDRISRRSFLSKGLAGVSLAATAPHFLSLSSRVFAGEPQGDRILVVLQLSGGNDGLSMVVPFEDPAYGRARRATARMRWAPLSSRSVVFARRTGITNGSSDDGAPWRRRAAPRSNGSEL